MSEGRSYPSGTKEALYMLSRGYCYAPECKERVMRWAENGWYLKAEVIHIHGLNETSARYNENVPVSVRNSFKNLILLCGVHHKLVDGKKTWMHYSVETLTTWKRDREGDLADDLDLIDWITKDKLQELMAAAIEEMIGKILGAIENISSVSRETLDILKQLVDQTLKLPYLDPEDIASLEYCAEVFEILPEYIPALHESARSLREIPEYSGMLYQSAHKLEELPDSVDALVYASKQLAGLEEHAPQLLEAAQIISGQSLWNYDDGVRQINTAVDRLRSMVSSLTQLSLITGGQHDGSSYALASQTIGQRPWKFFWWGIFTCAIFVVTILGLWTYVTTHK